MNVTVRVGVSLIHCPTQCFPVISKLWVSQSCGGQQTEKWHLMHWLDQTGAGTCFESKVTGQIFCLQCLFEQVKLRREMLTIEAAIIIPAWLIPEFDSTQFFSSTGVKCKYAEIAGHILHRICGPLGGKNDGQNQLGRVKDFSCSKWHINCILQNAIIFTVKTLILCSGI